jgi:hypothetical protein
VQVADHSLDPVVLTGAQFPSISAGPEVLVRHPEAAGRDLMNDCPYHDRWDPNDPGEHSCYRNPDLRITAPRTGVAVNSLRGWRWDGSKFVQIPFQVDEKFTRYLSNNASGFAVYSGTDEHTDYAFDREGWRFTDSLPSDPCRAFPYKDGVSTDPGPVTTPDPIQGLDDNDEMAFMASDSGPQAPGNRRPPGSKDVFQVALADPADPSAPTYVYISTVNGAGPKIAYTSANGYVHSVPDPNRDLMVYSQSSYGGYGAAPKGPICDPATGYGQPILNADGSYKIAQRRELDTGWVKTPRYEFRYDGRWLMTQLHVRGGPNTPEQPSTLAALDTVQYGADMVDRWKARAFAQDPSSKTPCCGYEEEDTNWGGSSILLGERAGPVRFIRATWGADSGTNVVREETFYRDSVDYASWLRVHVIPPADGIYTQWDYNAGRVDTYYNPNNPNGVAIDGHDDELIGNLDDPCQPRYQTAYGDLYRKIPGGCGSYHLSMDLVDPTFSNPEGGLQWEEITGDAGTVVDRWRLNQVTPGGALQDLVATSYYRDNSCFDDGTGTNPGPKLHLRSGNEPATYTYPDGTTVQRHCWTPADGIPSQTADSDGQFYQGSIGVNGLHLLFVAESDNAFLTKPLTEIDGAQRQVILPGRQPNVGETYGRNTVEEPLEAIVTDLA